jgi:hypothetical protein
MATNKPQFDSLLGGTQNLPPDFHVGRFASARAQEIAALTQAIGKCITGAMKLLRFKVQFSGL